MRIYAAWIVVAVAIASCTSILGIDDREEIPRPTTVQAGGAGGNGGAGTGGMPAASTGTAGQAGNGAGGAGGGPECSDSSDCAASAEGHVCDPGTHTCVECLTKPDCHPGEYCADVTKTCTPGCDDATDCNLNGGQLTCDSSTHSCLGCGIDDDCPPGLLCDPGTTACIFGCTDAHVCQTGRECCGGECANLLTDEAHCGLCGTSCMAPGAVPKCKAGACTWEQCLPGFGDCNTSKGDGCEIDLQKTLAHCGTCATPCAPDHASGICVADPVKVGVCGIGACATGWADCDGIDENGCEQDIAGDIAHCGACGAACDGTNGVPSCSGGTCTIACSSGFGNCDGNPANGCETTLDASVLNCGACGTVCATGGGTPFCAMGTCGVTQCPAGMGNCDGDLGNGCETSLTSVGNCQGCGIACSPPHATDPSCSSGTCTFTMCDAGWGDCDASITNGCETNTSADLQNCGVCGWACNLPNATASCISGGCKIASCASGWADCDGNDANGCETNTNTNVNACGACGSGCSFPNAAATCQGGQCTIGNCVAGYANCNGAPGDGCETLLGTTANCATCGNACNLPNASAICSSGLCAIGSCNGTYADCDGSATNGCEIDTQTNVNNCGTCGHACPGPGTPNCTAGTCGSSSCPAGTADCDNNGSCETTTTNDASNCGGCGNHCVVANGTGICANSTCAIGSCNAPYADCNGVYSDGCEANTSTSTGNCGTCGKACSAANGTPSCTGGSCSISCNGGWGNCNMSVGDGCEAPLNTPSNCLSCGNVCPGINGTPVCTPTGCSISCNANYFDCDFQVSNGCETHCVPQNAYPPASCSGASTGCQFNCVGAYRDCDNNGLNGCEADTSSNPSNCGYCGNVCSGQHTGCYQSQCGCTPPWGDCNATVDGCETPLNTLQDCQYCGNACTLINASSAQCTTSGCLFACKGAYADCDNYGPDGCEVDLMTNPAHCGNCSTACGVGDPCTNGVCSSTGSLTSSTLASSSTGLSSSSTGPPMP